MRNIVVTGATGFIGSWLIKELLKEDNITVTIVIRRRDNLLPEYVNDPKVKIIEKNIAFIEKNDFCLDVYDVFYHLAWGGVASEKKNDLDIQIENIKMSCKIMKICMQINCKKLIVAGSVAEYVFNSDVINTNEKQTPNDIYGAAKVSTHFFMDVLSRQYSVNYIWALLPSTFGEGRKDNNIITYTIKKLLKEEVPQYGMLDQWWDFLYVEDVVRALYLIGKYGKGNKTYGIGSGEYRVLRDYIVEIRDLINPKLKLGIGSIQCVSQEKMSSCVNINDLIEDTGFRPTTSFKDGIQKTIEYWRKVNYE